MARRRTGIGDVTGVVGGGGTGIDVGATVGVVVDARVSDVPCGDVLTMVAVAELVAVVPTIVVRPLLEPPELHAVTSETQMTPAKSAARNDPERVTATYDVYHPEAGSNAAT